MTLRLNAYAKINLFLDVTGRRADGYHDILSLMQAVDLCDTVTLNVTEELPPTISVRCDRAEIPTDQKNLAYRAAEAFYSAYGVWKRTEIEIEKRIPVSAGLAGGSTDAAAVLVGLNRLMGFPFSEEELCGIGKRLGADIPFCIWGGSAEVRGIGERILHVPEPDPPLWMVIAKKGEGVSTPGAYGALDKLFDSFRGEFSGGTVPETRYTALLSALREGNLLQIGASLYNVFERVVLPMHSEASALRSAMMEYGAYAALMSGSGPSVIGLFASEEQAVAAKDGLNRQANETVAFVARTKGKNYDRI